MANLGYALAQGLAGASRGVGILADQYTKQEAEERAANRQLANQERLMATQEMLKQRAKEWDQAQAGKRAGEIEADAQGILTGQQVKGVQDMYGDSSLTKDDLLPEELAMIDTSEVDRSRARTAAAEKRGYLTEAKEARGAFDSERRYKADEERTRVADKKADNDAEYHRGILDRQEKRDAERLGREKMIQVVDDKGSPRLVTREELNAAEPGKYKLVATAQQENKQGSAEEKGARTLIDRKEAQIAKMLPGKDKVKAEAQLDFMYERFEEDFGKKLKATAGNDPLGIRKAR